MTEIVLTCSEDNRARAVSSSKMGGRDVSAVNRLLVEFTIQSTPPPQETKKQAAHRKKKLDELLNELKGIYTRLFDEIHVYDLDDNLLTGVDAIFQAIDDGNVDGAISAWFLNLPQSLYTERQKLGKALRDN